MMGYVLLALPYILQLFCIVHVLKAHRDSYWIWIIIMLPFVGGIAYLIVEILPSLVSRRSVYRLRENIANALVPGKKLEQIRQKALYTPTHGNMVEYADALLQNGEYAKALDILQEQAQGIFSEDAGLIHKKAHAHYGLRQYDEAMETVLRLRDKTSSSFSASGDIALYLRILEKLNDVDSVKNEYEAYIQKAQDNELVLQYLNYLLAVHDNVKAEALLDRLRVEEASLKLHRIVYDRSFYKKAYAMGKNLGK